MEFAKMAKWIFGGIQSHYPTQFVHRNYTSDNWKSDVSIGVWFCTNNYLLWWKWWGSQVSINVMNWKSIHRFVRTVWVRFSYWGDKITMKDWNIRKWTRPEFLAATDYRTTPKIDCLERTISNPVINPLQTQHSSVHFLLLCHLSVKLTAYWCECWEALEFPFWFQLATSAKFRGYCIISSLAEISSKRPCRLSFISLRIYINSYILELFGFKLLLYIKEAHSVTKVKRQQFYTWVILASFPLIHMKR